jgi:hypothetical protein
MMIVGTHAGWLVADKLKQRFLVLKGLLLTLRDDCLLLLGTLGSDLPQLLPSAPEFAFSDRVQ